MRVSVSECVCVCVCGEEGEAMPPKKKEVEVEKPPLGRFSSHLKVGIVGMPNVGKSTMYNTLTKCSIPAENYPFCTIEPNVARVNLPDERFNWLKVRSIHICPTHSARAFHTLVQKPLYTWMWRRDSISIMSTQDSVRPPPSLQCSGSIDKRNQCVARKTKASS